MIDKTSSLVILVLGFVAIMIAGKFLLDKETSVPQVNQPAPVVINQPRPVVVAPYPRTFPQYHNRNEFWNGYSDGFNGRIACDRCPEYVQGYQIGSHDRLCNRPRYYHDHCPGNISVRVPGFSLKIR